MCASSCESTAARLASSGSTSTNPRLITMVLPTLKVSRGAVSSTRVRTGRGRVDVVGDLKIVDYGLENVVDVAFGREQARAGQPLDDVVFRLLLPYALGLQRRSILRG